jgi:hypothetical protein
LREVIRFPAYREYDAVRTDVSNAMMALLAGAGMASHLLQLTEGSKHLLPEVFPRVEHIGRFNLETVKAREILAVADTHLGAMSVPYALSIHEDFMRTCLDLLRVAGLSSGSQVANTKLAGQHRLIEQKTGGSFNVDSLRQLQVLRLMRNCLIHEGSRANAGLVNQVASLSAAAVANWVRLAPTPLGLRVDDPVRFGHGEMILTLAVTKVLARQANQILQPVIPKSQWADMVIDDLLSSTSTTLRTPDFPRKARGFSRFHYSALQLSDRELAAAKARHPV